MHALAKASLAVAGIQLASAAAIQKAYSTRTILQTTLAPGLSVLSIDGFAPITIDTSMYKPGATIEYLTVSGEPGRLAQRTADLTTTSSGTTSAEPSSSSESSSSGLTSTATPAGSTSSLKSYAGFSPVTETQLTTSTSSGHSTNKSSTKASPSSTSNSSSSQSSMATSTAESSSKPFDCALDTLRESGQWPWLFKSGKPRKIKSKVARHMFVMLEVELERCESRWADATAKNEHYYVSKSPAGRPKCARTTLQRLEGWKPHKKVKVHEIRDILHLIEHDFDACEKHYEETFARDKASYDAVPHHNTDYCGDCHGAPAPLNAMKPGCCNTCEEVMAAYEGKAWAFHVENVKQCDPIATDRNGATHNSTTSNADNNSECKDRAAAASYRIHKLEQKLNAATFTNHLLQRLLKGERERRLKKEEEDKRKQKHRKEVLDKIGKWFKDHFSFLINGNKHDQNAKNTTSSATSTGTISAQTTSSAVTATTSAKKTSPDLTAIVPAETLSWAVTDATSAETTSSAVSATTSAETPSSVITSTTAAETPSSAITSVTSAEAISLAATTTAAAAAAITETATTAESTTASDITVDVSETQTATTFPTATASLSDAENDAIMSMVQSSGSKLSPRDVVWVKPAPPSSDLQGREDLPNALCGSLDTGIFEPCIPPPDSFCWPGTHCEGFCLQESSGLYRPCYGLQGYMPKIPEGIDGVHDSAYWVDRINANDAKYGYLVGQGQKPNEDQQANGEQQQH